MLYAPHDTSLLLRAGQGDRQAFGALVEIHERAVFSFIQRFLGFTDSATAEDIAQDVFLAAWLAAPTFEPRASVRTWLLRITTNKCLNHRRRKRRKPTMAWSAEAESASPPGGGAPGEDVARADFSAELHLGIAALKERQRAAIILRYAHGLSHAEIAEVLSTNAHAIKALLYRAHRQLRDLINIEDS